MAQGLGWKRLDHVSIAVPDAAAAVAFYEKLFGMAVIRWFTSEQEGFQGAVLQMPNDQGELEVIEPHGEDSFLHRFLEQRGSAIHHVAVEVEDVEAAAAYLRDEMGIEPYRGIFNDHQWKQTFIHPRDATGVLYQLFEWLPGKEPDRNRR